ncbi:GNAT family N-acetyltransferase [Crossiella sp. CA198]|uniref:GNAT family N-acetyltransferase n=1 Tax=Crossiella sp. CA198 TaxID=3455607 RepID=UPI003F8D2F1E
MDPWPLRQLVLRTPRLELRPDDDAGLLELAELAGRGIHPPEEMPFIAPFTDRAPGELELGVVQYNWRQRAELGPAKWTISFLVRHQGEVIGTQGLTGEEFAITREVRTGSWLGQAHQGKGLGTEMRAAVLAFAFDHLGAVQARSEAFADNAASRAVSRRLGYQENGSKLVARRGQQATEIGLRLPAGEFVRPDWELQVDGLEACRELLGA